MEYFKDVVGYEGRYQVSNRGRVLSLRNEIVLKPIKSKRFGYCSVNLIKDDGNKRGKILKIHRLVMTAFVGESDLIVNHKDFDRSNNILSNLEYTTWRENTRHAIKSNRHPACRRELSPEQIREIRAAKERVRDIALKHNIRPSRVYSIKNKTSYADIE
jgi:NUMOD4 motif/HNH endonuclease